MLKLTNLFVEEFTFTNIESIINDMKQTVVGFYSRMPTKTTYIPLYWPFAWL